MFCGEQMISGVIRYDSRSGLCWKSEDEKSLILGSQLLKKMAEDEEAFPVNIAPLAGK